jgi:prevent-host-death family protein
MRSVSMSEARAQLSRLVDAAAAGEDVVIVRQGRPAVRLVAIEPAPQRQRIGRLKGRVWLADNFDAPLPEEADEGARG